MTSRRFLWLVGGLLAALLPASFARAQNTITAPAVEFGLGVGYANISLGSDSAIDSLDALRFEPTISFSPFAALPQVRLGADVGTSLVLDNGGSALIINNGGLIFISNAEIPFWTLEPEVRISWRQTFGYAQEFFIEPGAAAARQSPARSPRERFRARVFGSTRKNSSTALKRFRFHFG